MNFTVQSPFALTKSSNGLIDKTRDAKDKLYEIISKNDEKLLNAYGFASLGILSVFDYLIEIQKQVEQLVHAQDQFYSELPKGRVTVFITELRSLIEYALPYIESNALAHLQFFETIAGDIAEAIQRVITAAHMRRTKQSENTSRNCRFAFSL
jgi:hypothetical protein